MKLLRSLNVSRHSLTANKLRTALATMGIAIGVAAVIVMVAIGQGAQQQVSDQIRRMGTHLITVKAGQVEKMIRRERQFGNVTTLRQTDCQAIAATCPNVEAVVPVQDRTLRVKYGNITSNVEIVGTTAEIETVRNYRLMGGRFFTGDENKAGIRVAVLGFDVYKNLFKHLNPIDRLIRVRGIPFRVVGVLEPVGASAEGGNEDIRVIVPFRTAMRRVFNVRHLNRIYVKVTGDAFMVETEQQIRRLLRKRHGLERRGKADDFTIHNQVTALEMERQSGASFTFLIASVAAIALMVGGIGILAIMLLSVKERTGEIGLRRAIGARSRDILVQFLVESLILGIAGGLTGIVTGIAIAWGIGILTPLSTVIPIDAIGVSVVFSLITGLFFGVYPARKAAALDPITALRAD